MDVITPQKKQDLEQGINQGVVAPKPEEVLAQGELDISQFPIIAPDSNIDKFLSTASAQAKLFDTLGCNIFSSITNSEANINSIGGDPAYGGALTEFSERYACVKAGLNGWAGSSEQQWEDEVNNFGLVMQAMWPWTDGLTREQYFASIPDSIVAEGKKFLNKYVPFHRNIGVTKEALKEALKYGAVKIFIGTGIGWNTGETIGVVPKTLNGMNHAVALRYIDEKGYHIRDQYAPFLKCLAPDYIIYWAFQTLYKRKTAPTFTFKQDLWYGLSHPDNIQLQIALIKDGEFPISIPLDEHFGPQTLKAVQKFQIKHSIVFPGQPGYGRVGPITRVALNKLLNN